MEINKYKLMLVKEEKFKYNQKAYTTLDVVNFVEKVLNINKEPQEVVYILMLDTRNQIIGFSEISRGGLNMCNTSIGVIFRNILLSNCNKFILIHNHPSGEPTASKKDIEVTKKILKCTEILGIEFLDHIIIGDERYMSCMKEAKNKNSNDKIEILE